MEFGDWLRRERNRRRWDLANLAERSGVDASTISRIENAHTQATLDTAIRLCDGLNVKLTDLLSALVGDDALTQIAPPLPDYRPGVLTQADVVQFVDAAKRKPDIALDLLAHLINKATYKQAEPPLPPDWGTADILRLLVQSPVYNIGLNYPDDFDSQAVRTVIEQGGTLTFADVGVYIRGKRKQRGTTLLNMEKNVQRSASVLSRLEAGALERIKLRDVVAIDDKLGKDLDILSAFWNAASLHAACKYDLQIGAWQVDAYALASLLVTTMRWLALPLHNPYYLSEGVNLVHSLL